MSKKKTNMQRPFSPQRLAELVKPPKQPRLVPMWQYRLIAACIATVLWSILSIPIAFLFGKLNIRFDWLVGEVLTLAVVMTMIAFQNRSKRK